MSVYLSDKNANAMAPMVPLTHVNHSDLDYSITSPMDGAANGDFCFVIPLDGVSALPKNSITPDKRMLSLDVSLADDGALQWVGENGKTYRLNPNRVIIGAITGGKTLDEVDMFCVIVDAMTGENIAIGEMVINGGK